MTVSMENGKRQLSKPYALLLMDPSARVFHYGQAIFEGMKAYKDSND
jgi:branched-chain amino acid aminotransferase